MFISRKQYAVLQAIEKHIEKSNHSPTVREITRAVGKKSPSTTHRHLNVLKDNGYIQWEPECSRTIKVLRPLGGARNA